jgi:hypothetical protein
MRVRPALAVLLAVAAAPAAAQAPLKLPSDPRLRPGDRVKLEGGHIERYP